MTPAGTGRRPRASAMFSIIILAAALILALLAIVSIHRQIRLLRSRMITVGTVTACTVTNVGKNSRVQVVAAFTDCAQERRECIREGVEIHPRVIGERIRIHYERDNPQNCGLCTYDDCFGAAVFALVIAATLVVGVAAWRSAYWAFDEAYGIDAAPAPTAVERR
jgi:hypothetical protein